MNGISDAVRRDNWLILADPSWSARSESDTPPSALMIGGWKLNSDGEPGEFRPNPQYVPSSPTLPTDPIDGLLRRIADGAHVGDELVSLVRGSLVDVGCDAEDRPLLGSSPDGATCVVVATSARQRRGIDVDKWQPISGRILAEILPAETDVLLNPAGIAPFRLVAHALKDAQ